MVFPVVMYGYESWTVKKAERWRIDGFWTVVLEKTLESPLDYKDIQPVHPKGDQSWVFIGKDWCWSWNFSTSATWCEELTHLEGPWCWKILNAGGEGDDRGWDVWMTSLTWWTLVSASFGKPGVLQSTGIQRDGHDWATELNCIDWTDW